MEGHSASIDSNRHDDVMQSFRTLSIWLRVVVVVVDVAMFVIWNLREGAGQASIEVR